MIEIITSWLGLIIMLIGAMATFIGPKAWPAIRGWYSGVLNALLYPFRGAERKIVELYAKNDKVYENVKLLDTKLDGLIEQFKPNGGTTIKDSLNRIELKQASNENITSFLINSLDVPMFKTDNSGLFIWVSKAYADIYNSDHDELMEWGWLTAIHIEDVDRVRTRWKHSIEEKRVFEDNYRVVDSTGKVTSVRSRAAPTFFNNKIAGWIGALEIMK
jgi:PAS domain S-box-containing protein